MAVVLVFEGPGITKEAYETAVQRLTGGNPRMESPSDWPVPGLLAHIAGDGPNGFRVVDVWDSQEAVDRLGEMLMPILAELGIEGGPEVYPAYVYVSGS
jgi:hypothetical protein